MDKELLLKKQADLLSFFPRREQPGHLVPLKKRKHNEASSVASAQHKRPPTRQWRQQQQEGWQLAATQTDDSGRQCLVYTDGPEAGGKLRYWPSFMPAEEATLLYDHLRSTTDWSPAGGSKISHSRRPPRLQKVRLKRHSHVVALACLFAFCGWSLLNSLATALRAGHCRGLQVPLQLPSVAH